MQINRIFLACLFAGVLMAADPSTTLWYQQPAKEWMTQALPIGSGNLGAMLFGGMQHERIQFNEESLWIGDEQDTGAYQAFGEVLVDFSQADAWTSFLQLAARDPVGRRAMQAWREVYPREYPDLEQYSALNLPANCR